MTSSDAKVSANWEQATLDDTTYRIKISDHGQAYEFELSAWNMQYALATLLIEQHIYLTNADGLEITPVFPSE